jgi:hypothetical protein
MKTYPKTTLSDFNFTFKGHGHYKVTYTSPTTGKQWATTTSNMPLIDVTKNCDDYPKRKDLNHLKYLCKKIIKFKTMSEELKKLLFAAFMFYSGIGETEIDFEEMHIDFEDWLKDKDTQELISNLKNSTDEKKN